MPDTQYTKFHLTPENKLSRDDLRQEQDARISYRALGGLNNPQAVQFETEPFEQRTEFTGHVVAHLNISASKATDNNFEPTDIDLFITMRNIDADGQEVFYTGTVGDPVPVTKGWLRVSLRKVNDKSPQNTFWHPHRDYLSSDESLITPNEVYPVDVEVWPTNVVVEKGGKIVLEVSSGDTQGAGIFEHNSPEDRKPEVFEGLNHIHFGPGYENYVLHATHPSQVDYCRKNLEITLALLSILGPLLPHLRSKYVPSITHKLACIHYGSFPHVYKSTRRCSCTSSASTTPPAQRLTQARYSSQCLPLVHTKTCNLPPATLPLMIRQARPHSSNILPAPVPTTSIMNNTVDFHLMFTSSSQPAQLPFDQSDIAAYASHLSSPPGLTLPNGAVGRMVDYPPGYTSPMHRTQSLDFGIVIEGEIELLLDSGEIRLLKRGDVAVQRGTSHAWRNATMEQGKWARMFYVLMAAEPVMLDGGLKLEEDLGGITRH